MRTKGAPAHDLRNRPASAKSLYEQRQSKADAVLRRHGIVRLIAFGSRARSEAHPKSDLDLAGALPFGKDLFDLVHIKEELTEAFGVAVDFVPLDAVKGLLRQHLEREGILLVD